MTTAVPHALNDQKIRMLRRGAEVDAVDTVAAAAAPIVRAPAGSTATRILVGASLPAPRALSEFGLRAVDARCAALR
jgi:hypothetical protein